MKILKTFLISCLACLAPIQAMIIATGVVIFADLFTGVWAAKKRNEKISSGGLRRTITKMFVFEAAIILGFIIEKYMMNNTLPISKLASGLIAVVEAKSIMENLDTIYGQDLFKSLIVKLGSINDKKD